MNSIGKYHFKIYTCCCSQSWLAISFKLHCQSDLAARMEGVVSPDEIRSMEEEISSSSEMRKLVSEVILPVKGSKRIVNTDNYYSSVQLLELLRRNGLYGRGTVRANSKHFPRCFILSNQNRSTRGYFQQGVSREHKMVAASWVDANVVNIISNADASTTTQVQRQIKKTKVSNLLIFYLDETSH